MRHEVGELVFTDTLNPVTLTAICDFRMSSTEASRPHAVTVNGRGSWRCAYYLGASLLSRMFFRLVKDLEPVGLNVSQAQADVRRIYSGGWGGPAVSAGVWLAAALTADRLGVEVGAAVLFVGGALLIFPLNLALNRLMSGQADLPAGHPMRGLAIQTAASMSMVLLSLFLVAPWIPGAFFPLAMIAVGAHYFPFAHLYGEPAFVVAGAVQCVAGFLFLTLDSANWLSPYVMTVLLAVTSVALVGRHRSRSRS